MLPHTLRTATQPPTPPDSPAPGIGLKIHPDYLYANLYYWIVGDSHLHRSNTGYPFPVAQYPYASSELDP